MLMPKNLLVLILTFLSHWTFLAAAPPVLNLSEFPAEIPDPSHSLFSLQGETVQVRGFWYPISPDEGVLAPSPQVKSCCLKVPSKISQQLIVKGSLPSAIPQRAVTLEGIFKIEPLYNKKGEIVQYFVLDKAKEIESPTSRIWIWSISGVAGLFFLGLLIRWTDIRDTLCR